MTSLVFLQAALLDVLSCICEGLLGKQKELMLTVNKTSSYSVTGKTRGICSLLLFKSNLFEFKLYRFMFTNMPQKLKVLSISV